MTNIHEGMFSFSFFPSQSLINKSWLKNLKNISGEQNLTRYLNCKWNKRGTLTAHHPISRPPEVLVTRRKSLVNSFLIISGVLEVHCQETLVKKVLGPQRTSENLGVSPPSWTSESCRREIPSFHPRNLLVINVEVASDSSSVWWVFQQPLVGVTLTPGWPRLLYKDSRTLIYLSRCCARKGFKLNPFFSSYIKSRVLSGCSRKL